MIGPLLRVVLSLWSLGLAIPSATFSAECLVGALGGKKRMPRTRGRTARVAVLIPAHNESAGIEKTLSQLAKQLGSNDQLLVVADNCTDDTAEKARIAGATVLERFDAERRGKGYALSYGVAHLAAMLPPPEVVVVMDADCVLSEGGIDALAATTLNAGRPAQAEYAMVIPLGADLKTKIGAFAFRVKNLIRPRGLHRIGLGRQLAGTGMAFPWNVLRDAPDMRGHITEDLVLGLELALRDQAAVHCPDVLVESDIAPSVSGQAGQRQRWEQGHILAIREYLPKMLREAIRRRRVELLVLACDLAVPSLAILVMMIGGTCVATVAIATALPTVGWLPVMVACADVAMVSGGVAASWWVCGRDLLSARELCFGVPRYLLWKVPTYLRFLRRKDATEWVRAER